MKSYSREKITLNINAIQWQWPCCSMEKKPNLSLPFAYFLLEISPVDFFSRELSSESYLSSIQSPPWVKPPWVKPPWVKNIKKSDIKEEISKKYLGPSRDMRLRSANLLRGRVQRRSSEKERENQLVKGKGHSTTPTEMKEYKKKTDHANQRLVGPNAGW